MAGANLSRPLYVYGDVYAYNYINVNPADPYGDDVLKINSIDSGDYTFIVGGDLYLYTMLNLPYNSSAIVSGDINIEDWINGYSGGYISLYSNSKLFVGGNLKSSSRSSSSFSSGTLEIRGDMIFSNEQSGFRASNGNTTIFSGDCLQTVRIAEPQSKFDKVIINNHSDKGVIFETPSVFSELIDNGCKISYAHGAVNGWTLNGDETVDGDINLVGGVLDLNGYKLTVNGCLVQSGGILSVNGGELYVTEDYRIQSKNADKYYNSSGVLMMTDEADHVKIVGSFVMQSDQAHNDYLTAGILEIGGDLLQKNPYLHSVAITNG